MWPEVFYGSKFLWRGGARILRALGMALKAKMRDSF